jgi:hypothetical protein
MSIEYTEDDILDGIEPDPTPAKAAPGPRPVRRPPVATPVTAAAPARAPRVLLGIAMALLIVFAGFGAISLVRGFLPRPGPAPAPSPDTKMVARGKAFDQDLRAAQAAGWRDGAKALRDGKSVQKSQEATRATLLSQLEQRFESKVAPSLKAIVAEDQEPTDQAQRAELAQALDDLATGLDGQAHPRPRGPPLVSKLFGWLDHPSARERLVETLPFKTMAEAMPAEVGDVDGKPNVYLYKAWKDILGAYPEYPAQQIGDCTSFGSGHAVDLLQCIDIALAKGDKSQYRETSTEAIYGLGREIAHMLGGGDGCYGVAVSKALTEVGAVPRELVGAYSGQRAKQWGRSGVPEEIKAKAKDHRLGAATLVTTLDELDAALRNGYPCIVCSNQGFTMTRDADGVCQPSGSWAHCMFISARREKNGRVQYCICQSWGPRTPGGPLSDDQPPFSFWADGGVIARMIGGRDSLAFAKFSGFVARPIPAHWTYAGFAEQVTTTDLNISGDSATLVANLTPKVRQALEDHKPEILKNASSGAQRAAIKLAWPTFLQQVPTLLKAGIDLLRKELSEEMKDDLIPPPAPEPSKTATDLPVNVWAPLRRAA